MSSFSYTCDICQTDFESKKNPAFLNGPPACFKCRATTAKEPKKKSAPVSSNSDFSSPPKNSRVTSTALPQISKVYSIPDDDISLGDEFLILHRGKYYKTRLGEPLPIEEAKSLKNGSQKASWTEVTNQNVDGKNFTPNRNYKKHVNEPFGHDAGSEQFLFPQDMNAMNAMYPSRQYYGQNVPPEAFSNGGEQVYMYPDQFQTPNVFYPFPPNSFVQHSQHGQQYPQNEPPHEASHAPSHRHTQYSSTTPYHGKPHKKYHDQGSN